MPLVPFRQLTMGLVNGAENFGHGLANGATNAINRAGEMTYDAGQAIGDAAHHAAQALGWARAPDKWAAYPAYMHGPADGAPYEPDNDPNFYPRSYARAMLGNYAPNTLPKEIPNFAVYRADPTGRYGGKDGLETQPTRFNNDKNTNISGGGSPVDMYAWARELARAGKYGVPQLTAQQLAALALQEGRPDYGNNGADIKNPNNLALAKRLYPQENFDHGYGLYGARDFPVAVAEKMATAKRLGIPFELAWNGTGRSAAGTTGEGYSHYYQASLKAAAHPKNKQLVDFIQSALDAGAKDR
jgi:hypothetical protein